MHRPQYFAKPAPGLAIPLDYTAPRLPVVTVISIDVEDFMGLPISDDDLRSVGCAARATRPPLSAPRPAGFPPIVRMAPYRPDPVQVMIPRLTLVAA